MEIFDAIIIGAGQSGVPLSMTLARAGWKTALVEEKHVGGTCINEGCTPTKTMVASARVAYLARRASDYGVQTGLVKVDLGKVRQRKRDIVESFRSGNQRKIENAGAELLMGTAYFKGPKELEVRLNDGSVRQLSADKIFINTGSRPRLPELDGLEYIPYLDSTSIMELDKVPDHLLVIGGGYVGLEFGQMFRRFGSRVTIIQQNGQLLPREDEDVAQEILNIFEEDGIRVFLESRPLRIDKNGQGGSLQATLATPEGELTISGSHVLIAAGRVPNSDRLNLSAAGIAVDSRGFIQVNERLETNLPGVYAMGDVKGGPAFTHISYDDFRILRTNLIEDGGATIQGRPVPYTVFIDPQLGRIGLSEKEARAQGLKFKLAKMPMDYVARALEVDETRGFMKAIIDADSGKILGAAILGIEGGEVMAMLQIAMMGEIPYTRLKEAVFAHPTLAESLNNLFASLQ